MCALFHGLRLFSNDSDQSTRGRAKLSVRPKEALRKGRRARFSLESLETRDLLSGMVPSTGSAVPPTSGVVTPEFTNQFAVAAVAVSSTQVNLSWFFAAGNNYAVCESFPDSDAQIIGYANNPPTPADSYSVTGLSPDTSYTFYVVDTNYHAFSSSTTVTTWVAAPSFTLSAVPSGQAITSQVNVSWSTVPDATGYGIQYQANGTGPWISAASPGQSRTSDEVTGLSPNTLYDFQMSASNSLGTTTSSSQSVTTLGAGPPFTLSAASSSQVNVSWSDVAGGTDYLVDQQAANGSWSTVGSSYSSTSLPISGLAPYTPYTYKVGVVGSWGVSWANPQHVTTLPQPVSLSASLSYPAQVNLLWNSVPSAGDYLVDEQDASSGAAWQTIANTTGTSFETPALAADSDFNFKVGAVGAWGITWSNVPSELTLAAAPTLTATPAGPAQVNLSWSSVSAGATYGAINDYVIDQQTPGGWETLTSTSGTNLSFSVIGLNPNTPYTIEVGAGNASGMSYSNVASALTLPAAPSLQATAVSASQVNLSWNSNPGGSTGFVVKEEMSGSWQAIDTLGSGATSFPVSGLSAGTTYEFEVAAFNASGYTYSYTADALTFPAATTISATPASFSQVNLSWNTVTNAFGYLIDVYDNGVLEQTVNVTDPRSTGSAVTGLLPGTTYQFQVETYDPSGDTPSNTVSALTFPAAPSVALTAVNQTQVNVSWNSVASATSYVIDEYIDESWVQIATVSAGTTSLAVSGLTPGYAYNFVVGAVNASGTTWSVSQEITLRGGSRILLPG